MFRRLSVLLLIAAMLLSACGSVTKAPTSSSSAPAPAAAGSKEAPAAKPIQGVTDTEILIGAYHSLSGPVAALAIPRSKTWKAFWSALNDQGGINGRKVKAIVEDSSGDPQKSLALVKKLVEQDKVFAIVYGQNSPDGLATRSYLVEKGIPHMMIGCPLSECQAPAKGFWGAYMPYDQESAALTTHVLGAEKKTKVGVFYANNDYGKDNLKGVKAAAAKAGAQVVAEVAFAPSEVDMSAAAVKLKAAGAEVIYLASYPAHTNSLVQESKKIGFKPIMMGTQAQGIPETAKLVGADIEGFYTSLIPQPDMNNATDPDVKGFKEALAKYAPDVPFDSGNFTIWLQATATAELLKKAGKDLTVEAIDKAALTFKDFGPMKITWTPEQHWGISGYPIGRWNKTKVVEAKDYK